MTTTWHLSPGGHSKDMAHYNYLGHVNRRGDGPSDRARRKGYALDGGGIGENCCQLWAHEVTKSGKKRRKNANKLATEAVRLWMNSPGHRANLLHPRYRAVGIGSAHAKRMARSTARRISMDRCGG